MEFSLAMPRGMSDDINPEIPGIGAHVVFDAT
jgi:hypothetical protein